MANKRKRSQTKPTFSRELGTLANQIVGALKAAKDSEELREMGKGARHNIRAAGNRIIEAVQKAKNSSETRVIKAQAQKVFDIGKTQTKNARRTS